MPRVAILPRRPHCVRQAQVGRRFWFGHFPGPMHPLYPQAGSNKHKSPDQVLHPGDLLDSYHRPPEKWHEAPYKPSDLVSRHRGAVPGIENLIRDRVVVTLGQEDLP